MAWERSQLSGPHAGGQQGPSQEPLDGHSFGDSLVRSDTVLPDPHGTRLPLPRHSGSAIRGIWSR